VEPASLLHSWFPYSINEDKDGGILGGFHHKVRLGPLVLAFLLCASAVGAFSYAQHVMKRTEEIIRSRDGVAFLNAEKALEFYRKLTTPDENGRAFYDFVPKYKELQRKVEENKRTKGTMNVLGCIFAAGAGLNAYLAFRRKPSASIEPV
jgi:hypothetical protein